MPRIFPIIKKVIASGFASATTVVQLRPAPSVTPVVTGTPAKAPIAPGVGISPSPVAAVVPVHPGQGLTPAVTGSATAPLAPATELRTVMALQPVPISEGIRQEVFISHAGQYGASGVTSGVVSGSAWTNIPNAQGAHDGTLAGHNGALSAQDAYLDFTFPTFPNKAGLTVTSAKLRFYARQAGTALNNGNLRLYRGTAAAPDSVLLTTQTGNVDYLTTPYEVDLYALGFTTFASLEGFGARVRGTLAGGALTVTQSVDAVELVVTATA